jgi:hypothetical protein
MHKSEEPDKSTKKIDGNDARKRNIHDTSKVEHR